ncbi:MAG TPA: hypothetical protein PKZ32_12390 [Candidatus Melainabacteria bacterium]|nr:hypothetical protein [Candidatus Melainabacteria bacterium]
MKVILCADCGNVMKKYATRCTRCTRQNMVWYHPDDPELKKRVSQLTGVREPGSTFVSLLIVALIASAISGVVYAYQNFVIKPNVVAQSDSPQDKAGKVEIKAVAGTSASVPQ